MATTKKKKKKPATRTSPTHHKAPTKAKKKKRKPKTGLSEMISHEGLKKTGKAFGMGFIGGGISGGIDLLLPEDVNPFLRFGAHALGATLVGAAFDKPAIASGMGGAYGHTIVTELGNKMLSEMEPEEYADEDVLDEYPDALDENGTPMFLADDGEFYYMEEFSLSDQYSLSESFQSQGMYPQYVNASMY